MEKHIKYSDSVKKKKMFPELQPFLRHFTDPTSGTCAHNHGKISCGSDGRGFKACFHQAEDSSYSLGLTGCSQHRAKPTGEHCHYLHIAHPRRLTSPWSVMAVRGNQPLR